MKPTVALTVTSLLTILFSMIHLADDIVHGMSPGGLTNLPVVLIFAAWLYATLMLIERRPGLILILAMSILASGLPVIHMSGSGGLTAGIKSGAGSFFALTLLAVGATGITSVILSASGLRSLRRGRPK